MKKAVYRLILFAAITAFVLSLSPSVTAEPNSTEPNQQVCKAAPTSTTCNADKPEPAPRQKSAGGKENSQLQLAKEQLHSDFYKDDVDNLKWAIKVIAGLVTAFVGFAFASMGVILFKNKKDYEHALADAKEAARDAKDAAKNVRDLEKEAQGILAQAKAKLEEIDTKAKETMDAIKAEAKAGQEDLEKKGNEERQKSSKEAERQRKISELFNKSFKADEAKDYETAADCYRQIVEELKEENDPVVYYNWGTALSKLAQSKKGPQAETLFNQAIGKYQKAIEIKQDLCSAFKNWGHVLIDLAKLKGVKDAEDLLKQAEEKCLKAESLKTGEGAYNLACVYALRGNEEKCKEWLKVGEKAGTLATREHAMADDDLKSVREKEWFKKLRWVGE